MRTAGWIICALAFACTPASAPSTASAPSAVGPVVHATWTIARKSSTALSVSIDIEGAGVASQHVALGDHPSATFHEGCADGQWESQGVTLGTKQQFVIRRNAPDELVVVYDDEVFPMIATCRDDEGHSDSCPPIHSQQATVHIPESARVEESARIKDGARITSLKGCSM